MAYDENCECVETKIAEGSCVNLIFHILKGGSRRPYRVSRYNINAWYKDIFGNVISEYEYPVVSIRKPIYVHGHTVKIPLTARETHRRGRFDIFLKIYLEENVCIRVRRTIEICGDDCDCCCCDNDIHFNILLCNILYTDGITYVPHINGVWLTFTEEGTPPSEPVRLIPEFTIVDGYLYMNGENTGYEMTAVQGDKGDKGDDGRVFFWQVLSFPPAVGDTVKINGAAHLVTADDLPLASGTFCAVVESL